MLSVRNFLRADSTLTGLEDAIVLDSTKGSVVRDRHSLAESASSPAQALESSCLSFDLSTSIPGQHQMYVRRCSIILRGVISVDVAEH